jgi:predicted RNase H-like HicB family nuclease
LCHILPGARGWRDAPITEYCSDVFLTIEIEREEDGRWIAEVRDFPGVLAYGISRDEALARVQALVLRVLADRLEHGEVGPELGSVSFRAA